MIRFNGGTEANINVSAGDIEAMTHRSGAGLLALAPGGVTLHCGGASSTREARDRFIGYMQCLKDFDPKTYHAVLDRMRGVVK